MTQTLPQLQLIHATEFITSIEVRDTQGGKSGISPGDDAMVMFAIGGSTYFDDWALIPTLVWTD